MNTLRKTITASIDSISQNDIYLMLKARLFTVPDANLNGARCTLAFLDEIVNTPDKYVGLPLSVDVVSLCNGDYNKLGHMYDRKSDSYGSSMIGSFSSFEKEDLGDGKYALVGYGRIVKRYKKVCSAILLLFASNSLKFSFEVNVGDYEELEDGTILIDASEKNWILGLAIVSMPACPLATALELVAEITEDLGDSVVSLKGDDGSMDEKTVISGETEKVIAAEQEIAEQIEGTVNEDSATNNDSNVEVAEASTNDSATHENAEHENADHEEAGVYVETTTVEVVNVRMFDTDSGDCVRESIEHVTSVLKYEDNASLVIDAPAEDPAPETMAAEQETAASENGEDVSACKDKPWLAEETENAEVEEAACDKDKKCAEEQEDPEEEKEPCEECGSCENKENAEETVTASDNDGNAPVVVAEEQPDTASLIKQIAELVETVTALKNEIAEMKETKVVAETVIGSVIDNPFVSEMSIPKKWSLLEKEDETSSGSLFDKY